MPAADGSDCDGKQSIPARQSRNELLVFPGLFRVGDVRAGEGVEGPRPSFIIIPSPIQGILLFIYLGLSTSCVLISFNFYTLGERQRK